MRPTAVPMPTEFELLPLEVFANTSENSVLDPLKPMVDEFAMLLPMTSRFLAAALRPDSPC